MAVQAFLEMKVDGWNSEYRSIDNVLRHLQRKSGGYSTPSYASASRYIECVYYFCKFVGRRDPDKLVTLPKEELEELVHQYLDSLLGRGISKNTIKTIRTYLILHFRRNGYRREKELEIAAYHVPPRYRKAPEYIPNSEEILRIAESSQTLRDRAMILCLYTSGLRHNTFLALRYKDVKQDIETNSPTTFVPVYPEMKSVNNKACKNSIPYYTFFDRLSTDALKAYLKDRAGKFGQIGEEELLFHPAAQHVRMAREKAKFKVLNKNAVNIDVLRRSAKNAGIPEWRHIHAHVIRKSFEEVLRSRMPDGRILADKVQEFLVGHILPGSADPYFGSGIRVQGSTVSFDRGVAENLRKEYELLQFFPSRRVVSESYILETFNKKFLQMSNWTDEEIEALGPLSEIDNAKLQSLLAEKNMQKLEVNKVGQKVVPISEVKDWLSKGYEFVTRLDDKEAIVKFPK